MKRLAALALLLPAFAAADIIYSDLGPGGRYSTVTGWGVSASSQPTGYLAEAMPFTSTGNYDLTQIDLALTAGTGLGLITINADAGGVPGATLASFLRPVANLPSYGSCCTLQAFEPTSPLTLTAGSRYWIATGPGSTELGSYVWMWNVAGATGTFAQNYGQGWVRTFSANTLSAFDVQGNLTQNTTTPGDNTPNDALPEGSTIAMTALALVLGLPLRQRFFRKS